MKQIGRLLNGLAIILATGFGLGLMPVAPGTFGSLLGPPLVWAVQQLALPRPLFAVLAVAIILIASPICAAGARHFREKDPGQVVFDEIVSFFLVFLFVEVKLLSAVLGFLWFRLFDITKPWPAKRLENLPGGWGVLADDLAAGAYAGAALWATMKIVGPSS